MYLLIINIIIAYGIKRILIALLFFAAFVFFLFRRSQLALCLLNVVSVLCTTQATDSTDSRKTAVRSASAAVGTSAHLNSLQSSQESGTKAPAQTVTNGQTTYRVTTPEFSSISQPQNAYYTQPSSPTGGYFITVNQQGLPSGALSPGKNNELISMA